VRLLNLGASWDPPFCQRPNMLTFNVLTDEDPLDHLEWHGMGYLSVGLLPLRACAWVVWLNKQH